MRTIPVKELTLEDFRWYGSFCNLLDMSPLRSGEERSNEFYPDLVQVLGHSGLPASASVARVAPCEPVVNFCEFHNHTGEGILPIDGDCVIYVAKAGRGVDPKSIEAFRVPKGTFVSLLPGTVHGRQFACGGAPVHVLILLPERTYKNDCEFAVLKEEEQQVRIDM